MNLHNWLTPSNASYLLAALTAAAVGYYWLRHHNPKQTPQPRTSEGIFAGHGTGQVLAVVGTMATVFSWSLFIGTVAVANQVPFYSQTLGFPAVSLGPAVVPLAVVTPWAIEGVSWCFTLMASTLVFLNRDSRAYLIGVWISAAVIALGNTIHNAQRGDVVTGLLIGGLSMTGPLLVHAAIHVLLRVLFGSTVQQHKSNKRARWYWALRLIASHLMHPRIAVAALSYWTGNGAWDYSTAWRAAATKWRAQVRRNLTQSVVQAAPSTPRKGRNRRGGHPSTAQPVTPPQNRDSAPVDTRDSTDVHPPVTPDADTSRQGGVTPGDSEGGHPPLSTPVTPVEDPELARVLDTLDTQVDTPEDLEKLFGGDTHLTSGDTPDSEGGQGGDTPDNDRGDTPGVTPPDSSRVDRGVSPPTTTGVTPPDTPDNDRGDTPGVTPPDSEGEQSNRDRGDTPRRKQVSKRRQGGDTHPNSTAPTVTHSDRERAAQYYRDKLAAGVDPDSRNSGVTINGAATELDMSRHSVRRGFTDARAEREEDTP